MTAFARLVIRRRRWVLAAWLMLAVIGGVTASSATSALTYGFGLPGQPGYETNQLINTQFATGGDNAPILVVVTGGPGQVRPASALPIADEVRAASPGVRVADFGAEPRLLSHDGRIGILLVYPRPIGGADPYAVALPAVQHAMATIHPAGLAISVTGSAALANGGKGGAGVLAEVLIGAVGALVVLALVFGSLLALTPLAVAGASILTTFLLVRGLTEITSVSFIVQYLLALIGLGVAIDYSLLIVTRWREERGNGADNAEAVERALTTAGRSVLFSGITVAVSLAALIALPVPFLRSVGFTGLLIPAVSVLAALTLLPALLLMIGPRLEWPHRRSANPQSRLWTRIGTWVVRHRWLAAAAAIVTLLALALPVFGLHLGQPSNASLASNGGSAGSAMTDIDRSGLGAGLSQPIEILTADTARVVAAISDTPGTAGVVAPSTWSHGGVSLVDAWTRSDASSTAGTRAAAAIKHAAEAAGGRVGGGPVQTADFIHAVYGNAWWILAIIIVVTFALLARALRSVVLPLKALALNALSVAAAYGITVLIWQHGFALHLLFDEHSTDAVTVWVPIAAFAFLFGLSMDYEVFLLSRIREEHDAGHDTAQATVRGLARTGRLVTSAALILFLAFVALSRVPDPDVKILATALALGIVIDATIVRGILAPALVAAMGSANWWAPVSPRARLRSAATPTKRCLTHSASTTTHPERCPVASATVQIGADNQPRED